ASATSPARPSSSNTSMSAASTASASASPKARPRSAVSARSADLASRSREEISRAPDSERVRTRFSGANASHALDGQDPHLAVADLARARRLGDRLGHAGRVVVLHEDLDLHLGHEVDRVLGPAVHLGVAALTTETLDLGHRESVHAELLDCRLHVVEL